MGCKYKEGDYCHYTRMRCSSLNWGCRDDFNQCSYMSYEKQKALEEESRQREAERQQRKADQKAARKREREERERAELEIQEAQRQAAENKARQEARAKELAERRERARAEGLRIEEDVKSSKLRNKAICMVLTMFLICKFVTHVNPLSGSMTQEAVKLFFISFTLTLPMVFFSALGLKFYGKPTFFGNKFKGSAFLRSYLATLIPSLAGLILAWIIVNKIFNPDFSVLQVIGSVIVYLVVCIPAWWLNHYSLSYIMNFNIYKE